MVSPASPPSRWEPAPAEPLTYTLIVSLETALRVYWQVAIPSLFDCEQLIGPSAPAPPATVNTGVTPGTGFPIQAVVLSGPLSGTTAPGVPDGGAPGLWFVKSALKT